jgi:hypothetical protein
MSFMKTIDIAKALHNRLAAHLMVQHRLGDPPRLYDAAPEDPVFPYLTYGDMRSEDNSGDGVRLIRHTVTLHIWSRYAGRTEVIEIISAVTRALEEMPLSVVGNDLSVGIPYVDVLRAPDGRTLHGLIRLNIYDQTLEAAS